MKFWRVSGCEKSAMRLRPPNPIGVSRATAARGRLVLMYVMREETGVEVGKHSAAKMHLPNRNHQRSARNPRRKGKNVRRLGPQIRS